MTNPSAQAMLELAETSFEFIRLKLINSLDEPARSAFWKAVESRDALRAALRASQPAAQAPELRSVSQNSAGPAVDSQARDLNFDTAKVVPASRDQQAPAGTGGDVREQCIKIAKQAALRCVREGIPGDSVANFIAQNIRDLVSPPQAPDAVRDIAAERQRQIDVEGWTPEHDDTHAKGEMARAAAVYALTSAPTDLPVLSLAARLWPWSREWLKPRSKREDLVRAGALIIAEIERLDRAGSRG